MIVTLLDMAAMFVLPPDGEVTGLWSIEDGIYLDFATTVYGPFLRKYKDPVTTIKYTTFLLYWLCRFVIYPPAVDIVSAYLRLAQAIAKGRKLTLRPFVLSLLYRSINDFVSSSKLVISGGPFWMLQI